MFFISIYLLFAFQGLSQTQFHGKILLYGQEMDIYIHWTWIYIIIWIIWINGLMDKLDVNIHHNYSISSIFDFGLVFCVIVEGLKHCGHDYLQYAGNLTVQIIILLNIDGVFYFIPLPPCCFGFHEYSKRHLNLARP